MANDTKRKVGAKKGTRYPFTDEQRALRQELRAARMACWKKFSLEFAAASVLLTAEYHLKLKKLQAEQAELDPKSHANKAAKKLQQENARHEAKLAELKEQAGAQ